MAALPQDPDMAVCQERRVCRKPFDCRGEGGCYLAETATRFFILPPDHLAAYPPSPEPVLALAPELEDWIAA